MSVRKISDKERLRKIWKAMVKRCLPIKEGGSKNYGGRGISVCKEWRDSFESFYLWAIENGYEYDKIYKTQNRWSIDRIDNDGDYCQENCRWVTKEENGNNQRTNINLTFKGKTQSVARWARDLGIPQTTLYNRLKLYGWTVERALTTRAVKGFNGNNYSRGKELKI